MKRLSARLLALGLVVCSVPSNVYAASPTPIVIVKEDAAGEAVEESVVTVVARFNTNRITFNAVDGAESYQIQKAAESNAADDQWEDVGTSISATEETLYSQVVSADAGTHFYYRVKADMGEGQEAVVLDAAQAKYKTGVDAVHESAALHYDFTDSPEGTEFAGNRMETGSEEDIAAISGLKEGTVLLCHKPVAGSTRTVIFNVKQEGATTPATGDIAAGTGVAFFRDSDGKFRADFGHELKASWNFGAAAGAWNVVALSSSDKGFSNGKVLISSVDGTERQSFPTSGNGENLKGFFTKSTELAALTVGGTVNGDEETAYYNGHIAYITVTGETLDQSEINAYTGEMKRLLDLSAPVVSAQQEDDQVTLSWTPDTNQNTLYEISINGEDWVEASGGSHSVALDSLSVGENTIKLRVKNGNGIATSATFEKEDAGEVEDTAWTALEALKAEVEAAMEAVTEESSEAVKTAKETLAAVLAEVGEITAENTEEEIEAAKAELQEALNAFQEVVEGESGEGSEEDVASLFETLKTKRKEGQQMVIAQMNNAAVSAQVTALNEAVNTAYAVSATDGADRIRQSIEALDNAIAALNSALEELENQGPLQQIREFLKVHYSFEDLTEDTREIPNLGTGEGADAFKGTLHEDTLKVVDEEVAGKALKFTDNTSEYLQIPGAMALSESYTVGLWVKFDAEQINASRSDDLILVQPKAANSDNGRTHLMVTTDNKLATYMDKTTRKAEEALGGFGKWQHVLISYDSEEKKVSLYVNGRSVHEAAVTEANIVTEVTDLFIGRHKTAGAGSFQGYMDEITVYNAALDATQVDALYKSNANRRVWPDLSAMITEAEALLEAAELGTEANESKRLVQVLEWIEEDNINKDSSYEKINTYIASMAPRLEAYKVATAAPQAPKDLAATSDNAKKEVTLTWTAADGRVTAYEYSDDNGATWKAAGTGTTFKVTGLEYDKEYSFQVRAKNGEKAGDASNTVKVTLTKPVAEKPAAPTGLRVQVGDKEATVSWTAVAGVTYKVQKNGDSSWTNVTTGSSHKFTGLTNGTEYTFSVKAVKDGQESDAATIKGTPAEATQPEKQTVATPAITPATGTYTEAQDVTITCATQGAKIYYTTDGSAPTASSTLYAGKITVSETTTIKAIAVKDGMNNSEVVSVTITINADDSGDPVETKVAAPAFSKAAGTFTSTQKVAITTTTEGAKIYYTTNGSTPTQASKEYTGEITVDKSMLIKAIAVKEGLESSDVVSIRYEMEKEWMFIDVSSKDGWRYNAAKYTYNAGIMGENGSGSKKFDTELNLTRGMFVTVLYRMAGEPSITFEDKFPDVKTDKYYAKAVIWANKNGIVDGKPDGTFGPDLNITRAEIAKMLKGYAAYCGFDVSLVKDLNTFSDGAAVIKSNWKKEALQWATAVEMITGKTKDGKTNLAADDNATRGECAQMIRKFAIKYLEYVE